MWNLFMLFCVWSNFRSVIIDCLLKKVSFIIRLSIGGIFTRLPRNPQKYKIVIQKAIFITDWLRILIYFCLLSKGFGLDFYKCHNLCLCVGESACIGWHFCCERETVAHIETQSLWLLQFLDANLWRLETTRLKALFCFFWWFFLFFKRRIFFKHVQPLEVTTQLYEVTGN